MNEQLDERLEQWLRHVTLRRAIPTLALIVFLIAWNRGIALLYGLQALLIATFLITYLAPRFNLRRISVARSLPASAQVGETLTMEYRLEKSGLRPSYMLELFDTLPFTGEAGQRSVAFIDRLKGVDRLRLNLSCELRGEHRLGEMSLRSSYPLGIHESRLRLNEEKAPRILVYPRTFPIHSLPLIGSSQAPISGSMAASSAGGGELFFGIREYRHGDNPRHVHWSATAKRDELVVKQYEYLQHTHIVIVLDLNRRSLYGEGRHTTIEYMMSIAASVARFALSQGHQVGLFGLGEQRIQVPLGQGERHYRNILELLARLQADGDTPYHQVVHEAVEMLPQGGVPLLFEMNAAHTPEQSLDMYRHHLRPLRVRFNTSSFLEERTTSPRRAGGAGNYSVYRGDDLSELFNP